MFRALGFLLLLTLGSASHAASLPEPGTYRGHTVYRDLAYGPDKRQRLDIYLPDKPSQAKAVILMVHGGAWRIGDKAQRAVIDNKLDHWLPQGLIFASANYRLSSALMPRDQADDVARALAALQNVLPHWLDSSPSIFLMGHSAGAHLVALLGASPEQARSQGANDWKATIAIDSAAMDLPALMAAPHPRFYDRVFGDDPTPWRANSPRHQLTPSATPFLLICSSKRDNACPQASQFADTASKLDVRADVLEQALSHLAINRELGKPGDYTDAVDRFINRHIATP